MDKEKIVSDVRAKVEALYPPWLLSCGCLYWAGHLVERLRAEGVRAIIQGGTAMWPMRGASWADDGVSPTHFSYEWDIEQARSRLIQKLPVEIHIWAAIPATSTIIDLSTKYAPEQCERILGQPWTAPRPPDYLWTEGGGLPQGMRYYADLLGCKYAAGLWDMHLDDGFKLSPRVMDGMKKLRDANSSHAAASISLYKCEK
jgi:hypothetical protein